MGTLSEKAGRHSPSCKHWALTNRRKTGFEEQRNAKESGRPPLFSAAELTRTVRTTALLLGVFEYEPRTSYSANFLDLIEQSRGVMGEIVWMLDGVSVQRLHIC